MNRVGRALIGSLVSLVVFAGLAGVSAAQESQVVVDLMPLGGSSVGGSAVVAGLGSGTTVDLGLRGLEAGTEYTVSLHAGTCEVPSASTALIVTFVAEPNGTATPSGEVLFQDRDPVAFEMIADEEHVLIVNDSSGEVACAVLMPSIEPATTESPAPAASGNAGLASSRVASAPFGLVVGVVAGAVLLLVAARRFAAGSS